MTWRRWRSSESGGSRATTSPGHSPWISWCRHFPESQPQEVTGITEREIRSATLLPFFTVAASELMSTDSARGPARLGVSWQWLGYLTLGGAASAAFLADRHGALA